MNPLTDESAFNFADRIDQWREIDRKFREIAKAERRQFYLRTIGAIVGSLFAILAFSSCTIAPKGTPPPKVTSEWAKHNVLGYDKTGYTMSADWVRAYHSLLAAYGNKLPITERVPVDDMAGITPSGPNFHVTFGVNKRFTDLLDIEANPGQ